MSPTHSFLLTIFQVKVPHSPTWPYLGKLTTPSMKGSHRLGVVGVWGLGGNFFFDWGGGGGCPMRQVLFRRVRSVHSPSILSFWNARFQKFNNFAGARLLFNIHIFRFKADAGFQVDINFNTESKFSFSRSSKPDP